jgi:6,7-dimethyl-8-ribityllumazine synthase
MDDQMRSWEGKLSAAGFRFAIVVSRFNSFITERLLGGAIDGLVRSGGSREAIEVVHVPGSREIPLVARELARSGRFDAVICLGCVIRGETTHYDYVAEEVSKGVAQAAMETGVPAIFGSRPRAWWPVTGADCGPRTCPPGGVRLRTSSPTSFCMDPSGGPRKPTA